MGHQYIEQLSEEVRAAIFGNVGTIICFRIGAEDAEFLEKEFMPVFTAQDLVNLSKYEIYLKLMIDGVASRPFSAQTLDPIENLIQSFKDVIIENSRSRYANDRLAVERKIASEWISDGGEIEEKLKSRSEQSLGSALSSTANQSSSSEDDAEKSKLERKPRPPVNINDLRMAIEESLKNKDDEESEQRNS